MIIFKGLENMSFKNLNQAFVFGKDQFQPLLNPSS